MEGYPSPSLLGVVGAMAVLLLIRGNFPQQCQDWRPTGPTWSGLAAPQLRRAAPLLRASPFLPPRALLARVGSGFGVIWGGGPGISGTCGRAGTSGWRRSPGSCRGSVPGSWISGPGGTWPGVWGSWGVGPGVPGAGPGGPGAGSGGLGAGPGGPGAGSGGLGAGPGGLAVGSGMGLATGCGMPSVQRYLGSC
jgi:hypothetical protein